MCNPLSKAQMKKRVFARFLCFAIKKITRQTKMVWERLMGMKGYWF